jgi:hypothetical protein
LEALLTYHGNLDIAKYLYESGGKEAASIKDIVNAAGMGVAYHGCPHDAYEYFKKIQEAPKPDA